jgi:hypothetical protein
MGDRRSSRRPVATESGGTGVPGERRDPRLQGSDGCSSLRTTCSGPPPDCTAGGTPGVPSGVHALGLEAGRHPVMFKSPNRFRLANPPGPVHAVPGLNPRAAITPPRLKS